MAYQDFMIDKRIVQRNIDKGLVEPKQLSKLLTGLPDRADNVAIATDDDDDDDDDLEDEDEG
ncbi:MAG: hypothetical protein M3Y87_17955 [Myxococcota bacterium]|nr:hypothetical protein [Myxococcota bacterium]